MADELRHAYAHVDGVRLHWAELGTATSRPPIVLLHGIADAHLSWRPVAPELAGDRLVLMPDLPGCGLSERPDASYRLEWEAQMIARWLEQLELTRVDVIGHSYGGGVAQMLLLACPTRIRRVVLVASGGLGRSLGFWLRFGSFPKAVELWGQPFMAFGTRRALGSSRSPANRADVAALAAMNARPVTARAFSRMVRDVIDWRGQTRLFLQRAHEVEAFPPIAVFWGERDPIIPIAQGKDFAACMPGTVFRSFPDGGHYVHRDCAKEFAAATLQFLDDPNAEPARLRALAQDALPVPPSGVTSRRARR
jgi:pimeloyl-ACP methyl ester carboxylesterase